MQEVYRIWDPCSRHSDRDTNARRTELCATRNPNVGALLMQAEVEAIALRVIRRS